MSSIKQKPRTVEELKKFGLTMTTVLVFLSALLLWRGKLWAMYFLYIAAAFLVLEVFLPKLLGPIERGWLAFGEKMGAVMTRVILTIAFYIGVTPMGLLLRLMGKDLLKTKFDRGAGTYWEPVDPEGPHTRPFLPY